MQSKVQVAPDSPMQQASDSPIQNQIVFFSFPGVISFVMCVGKLLFGLVPDGSPEIAWF